MSKATQAAALIQQLLAELSNTGSQREKRARAALTAAAQALTAYKTEAAGLEAIKSHYRQL